MSFNWRRTTGNSAAFIKVFVGKLTKNVTSNKYCVHALFPRCYLLRVRQYQKGNGCTFPSLFQVMKKPYSSTFTWQLGSNMYGSCRDKEGGASLKIHLTWRNIKQPTHGTHNCLSQQHRHHTNSFSMMYLVTGTHMHNNMTKIYEKCTHYVHVLHSKVETVSWDERDECQLTWTSKISDLNTLMCTEGERQQ